MIADKKSAIKYFMTCNFLFIVKFQRGQSVINDFYVVKKEIFFGGSICALHPE